MKPAYILAAAAGVIGGVLVMVKKNKLARGIRNNNPLNIEQGEPWKGLAPVQTDNRFAVFTDARYGFRAGARILENYALRGVDSVWDIVSTWAPSRENDVEAYVSTVARLTGWPSDKKVKPEDRPALMAAMVVMENGYNPYSPEEIAEGVSWA